MDNEAIVDQIIRSLSFEVVAVPQDIIHINSTSKSTPLNLKIRVRKKNDAGLRHGVLSTPKVDLKDNVPDRIRLVSSDHTIMSFNALIEADFDNAPPKHNKQNLNMESRGLAQKDKKCTALSKHADRYSTPILAKRNKNVFGTCKPGGCLDPPFGEEKYSYQPVQQNVSLPAKSDDTNKLRSSSIFKTKLFGKKKIKSQELNEPEEKESPKPDSILSIYEAGFLQSSTNYSNSIMTYPHSHPSNSSLLRLEEKRIYKKRCSSQDKSNISVREDNGSYFILPKKTKKLIKQNDIQRLLRCDTTEENDFNIIKKTNETVEPKQKYLLRATVKPDEKMKVNSYKSSQLNINELKHDSKSPNFMPISSPIPLPVELNDNKKESIVENHKAEPLLSNDNISSISDYQMEQKILKKDNNKESIAKINKSKDGAKSPMPNDDMSPILDNQIKQKILLKDDNNKESTVEMNKTKDRTDSPMPNDKISPIMYDQVKQIILLNNEEYIVENNKTEGLNKLLNSKNNITSIADDQIIQNISVLNSATDLVAMRNSEDNSALPDVKSLNCIENINEDITNTTDEIHPQDKQTKVDEDKKDNICEGKTLLTNQTVINVTSPSTSVVYKSSNDKISSEDSEITSHLLVITRVLPLLDLIAEPAQQVKDTGNVGDVSSHNIENKKTSKTFSLEDLKNIWENKAEPLESTADVVTKTTLPTEKSFVKDVLDIEEHLTGVPEDDRFSAGIIELKQPSKFSLKNTFSHHMADTKIEVKSIYPESSLQSTRNDNLNHHQSNAKLTKVKTLQDNFSEIDSKLVTDNLPRTDVTKIMDEKSLENFKMARNVSINKNDRKLSKNINSNILKNKAFAPYTFETNNLIRHILKSSEESSLKSNDLHLTSTTKSLSQTVIDKSSEVNNYLSKNLSNIDLQPHNMSNSHLMKFKTDEDPMKAVMLSFSDDNDLSTKESSGYKTPVSISTQSITDTNSFIYKVQSTTVTDALNSQYGVYTTNILNSGITETVHQRKVGYMDDLTLCEDVKNSLKTTTTTEQFSSNNLSVSYKVPLATATLRKSISSWKVDIALQSYNDKNNKRVIKSYDSDNMQARRKNDALLVAKCLLRSESNEIKIPIDPENDLCVTIKSNKLRNLDTTNVIDPNENSILSDEYHKRRKIKMILLDSVENNIDFENVSKSETKPNKKISGDMREVLTKIYEQELVPLQHIIKGLREEIDMLAAYQMKFKEKVPVTVKRSRPLKLVNGNKKCPCVRRL